MRLTCRPSETLAVTGLPEFCIISSLHAFVRPDIPPSPVTLRTLLQCCNRVVREVENRAPASCILCACPLLLYRGPK